MDFETNADLFYNRLNFASGHRITRGSKDSHKKDNFYEQGKTEKINFKSNITEAHFAIGSTTIKHGVETIDPDIAGDVDQYSEAWF